MNKRPDWLYNELKQAGTDYSKRNQAEAYDSRIQQIENVEEENEGIIRKINLICDQSIIDLGAGTGTFAIQAAKHCQWVYAVDVSDAMLKIARRKAREQSVTHISFHVGGFLTYEHVGKPADAVVSKIALHHLPDLWKLIALYRVANMLKDGGKFYLKDVVFSFDPDNYQSFFSELVRSVPAALADGFRTHIREEYSTFDWIMEGLLKRAGFVIDEVEYRHRFMAHYLCSKVAT